ncbi:MAG: UPF0104 family protein [Planctomycetales bacterium]|nr:UPF0104 family protein [Planctomycetales bacterium]
MRSLLRKLRSAIGPILALVLFSIAIIFLIRDLKEISWDEFVDGLTGAPPLYLAFAALLIALNYCLLITYDMLALRYVRRALPLRRVALVGFLGYALGNNLGTIVAATPLRFRLYTHWGLRPMQIAAIVVLLGLTFWSGICWLAGTVLLFVPVPVPEEVKLPFSTETLGGILLSVGVAYALICHFWQRPLPIGGINLAPPKLDLMMLQTSVAAMDLTISAIALYLVLPESADVPFALVLAAYLMGITASLVSQIPGGLVVLELILLKLLADEVGNAVIGSLLIFRLLYYVAPLIIALPLLGGYEWSRVRSRRATPTADTPIAPSNGD